MQTSAVFLHDDARDHVFKGFVEGDEALQALFDDICVPLGDLVVVVGGILDGRFNRLGREGGRDG